MGLCLDVYVRCILLDMYSKCDSREPIGDAGKVFERMRDHNVTTWSAMITRYVQSGGHDRTAIELYCKMITQGDTSLITLMTNNAIMTNNELSKDSCFTMV